MQTWIKWSFAGSIVLSAFALFPDKASQIVSATTPRSDARPIRPAAITPELNKQALTEALADPFLLPVSKASATTQPSPRSQAASVAPPPPQLPPSPPGNAYRYIGRFVSPEGTTIVLIGDQDSIIQASVGMQLANGYVVEDITTDTIKLVYPPLDSRSLIVIPTPTETPEP